MPGLIETLRAAWAGAGTPAVCVAFSGGPDSTALLHALAQTPEVRAQGLRALHVDHGLHADSAAWARRCAAFCATLDLPLTTVRADVDASRGEGIEAAARRARYAAFTQHLRQGEWLALAHHRDDQIETVLLKLLRGAGPEGLGGMRALRPFARGFLWRPLLEIAREVLTNYLNTNNISFIDDPANHDPRFARNVLRHEILPRLGRHWPHFDAGVLHAAKLARGAADFIESEATIALAGCLHHDHTVAATAWLALPAALRAGALDAWLHALELPAPPDAARAELERQAMHAAGDRVPRVTWPGAEVRIWDGRLHATPPLAPPPVNWRATWDGTPLALPDDCGTLTLGRTTTASRPTRAMHLEAPLTVRFRTRGERIKPAGDVHTRELRDLFQQSRMPPWLRARCPLIHEHDKLIAVADLWTSERGGRVFAACGSRPRWTRPAWAE